MKAASGVPSPELPPETAGLTEQDFRRLTHDLDTHRTELELQNEELRAAQAAAQEASDRYLALYDQAPAGYVVLDGSGIIRQTNATWLAMAGRPGEDVRGTPFHAFLLEDDAAVFLSRFRTFFKNPENKWIVGRIRRGNGTVFTARIEACAIHAEDSRTALATPRSELMTIVTDISELQHAQARADRLVALLRGIRNVNQLITKEDDPARLIREACVNLTETLSYHNAWLVLLDRTGRRTLDVADAGFNGDFAPLRTQLQSHVFPSCVEKALAQNAVVLIDEPAADCATCPLAAGYRGRTGIARRLTCGDTCYGVLAVSAPPEFARDPEEQALFAELADDLAFALHKIDMSRKSDEYERRFVHGFHSNPSPMAITDLDDRRFVDVNRAFCDVTGYAREQVVGRTVTELNLADDPERYREQVTEMLEHRRVTNIELAIRRQDGSVRQGLFSGSLFEIAGRHYALTVMNDITARKHAEAQVLLQGQMLDEAPAAITVHNEAGRFLYANRQTLKLHGYDSHADFLAVNLHDLDAPASAAQIAERVGDIATKGAARFEVEHYRKDRTIFPLEVNAKRILWHGQSAMLSIAVDITTRKAAEAELRASEERNRLLSDVTMEGIVIHRDAVAHDLNVATARMLGYPREELLGKDFRGFVHPDDRERVREEMLREYAAPYVIRMARNNGEYFHVEVESRNLVLNQTTWRVSALRDLSERMRAQAALQASEDRFARAFQTAPYAIAITRAADGLLQEVNQAFVRITGYEREEAIGQTTRALNVWQDAADRQAVLDDLRAGQAVENREYRFRRKDGGAIVGLFSAQLLTLGDEVCVLSSINDITRQHQDREEKERLRAELQQAQKMESVGRLAGGVAHDFNNLLMVIMGGAELCRGGIAADHPIRADLDEITAAAERAGGLTRQLLAFARKQTIAPRELDINAAVAGTLKILRRLIGEDIELTWRPGGGVWPVKLDPGQLDQVLANVCVNARDAIAGGSGGRIRIGTANVSIKSDFVTSCDLAPPGDYVMLSVSDTGKGMDAETLSHVFEPFFTTKDVGQGTGLGLATVHGIAKQNGGFINVVSEPGRGTTFEIHWPRYWRDPAESPDGRAAPADLAGGSETILLVEDDPAVGAVTGRFLARQGYRLLLAHSPSAALDKVRAEGGRIDLLVTDVVMPEMSGLELSNRIHAMWPRVKCLFISGYTADIIAHRGIIDAGTHFLSKPFTRDEILRKVREVLDRSTETPGDAPSPPSPLI